MVKITFANGSSTRLFLAARADASAAKQRVGEEVKLAYERHVKYYPHLEGEYSVFIEKESFDFNRYPRFLRKI